MGLGIIPIIIGRNIITIITIKITSNCARITCGIPSNDSRMYSKSTKIIVGFLVRFPKMLQNLLELYESQYIITRKTIKVSGSIARNTIRISRNIVEEMLKS